MSPQGRHRILKPILGPISSFIRSVYGMLNCTSFVLASLFYNINKRCVEDLTSRGMEPLHVKATVKMVVCVSVGSSVCMHIVIEHHHHCM